MPKLDAFSMLLAYYQQLGEAREESGDTKADYDFNDPEPVEDYDWPAPPRDA